MKEKVSVAMATYNGERYIKEQIKTILQNLEENDELVISDDGSKDNTINIIKSFKDKRIKLLDGPRKGLKQNFNNAIKNTTGDYIFLSDQDDIWMPDKVRKTLEIFRKTDYILIQHDAIVVDENDNIIFNSFAEHRKVKTGIIKNLIKNSYHGCCIAFKSALKAKILPIPDNIYLHDQWIGMIAELEGKTYFFNEKLIKYRRHRENNSSFKHLPVKQMVINRWRYIKTFFKYINQKHFLKKNNIFKNIIYEDKNNKRIIVLHNGKYFKFDLYYNNEIYTILNFAIKKSIKNKFLKNNFDDKLKIHYLYFINNYYNRFPYYYYNQIINELNNGKKIDNNASEKFLKENKIFYKRKKSLKENMISLRERVKIYVKYYFKIKRASQKEILEYCKENKIDNYIYRSKKLNILSGSIDVFLIEKGEKKYFLKGYDIYNIYENEERVLNKLNCELFPRIISQEKNFFVEEFFKGITLDEYVKENKIDSEFIENFKLFSIACLDKLYEKNIIHRDIRPENIIVIKDNNIRFKLIDFGCATVENDDIFIKKKNFRILDTIGEEYIYDKHFWDDAISFLIIYEMLGIRNNEDILKRVGRLVERLENEK